LFDVRLVAYDVPFPVLTRSRLLLISGMLSREFSGRSWGKFQEKLWAALSHEVALATAISKPELKRDLSL